MQRPWDVEFSSNAVEHLLELSDEDQQAVWEWVRMFLTRLPLTTGIRDPVDDEHRLVDVGTGITVTWRVDVAHNMVKVVAVG